MSSKETKKFLLQPIVVEEKIDGANLGVWMNSSYQLRFQNRAKFVTSASATQWNQLDVWAKENSSSLFNLLCKKKL
jgi:hypothetical protein